MAKSVPAFMFDSFRNRKKIQREGCCNIIRSYYTVLLILSIDTEANNESIS